VAFIAQAGHAAGRLDGCELLPKEQVAEFVGGPIDTATRMPLAKGLACMYDGPALSGADLMVDLQIDKTNPKRVYDEEVTMDGSARGGVPVPGLGDKAIWSRSSASGQVSDSLDVLSEPYVVSITSLGSGNRAPSSGAHGPALWRSASSQTPKRAGSKS
jgi:hypothetical protein